MYQASKRVLRTLLIPALLGAVPGMAQYFVFTATIIESVPDTSAKPLFSAITGASSDAELFHYRDRDTLVILTTYMFTFEELEVLVNSTGFTLIDLDRDFIAGLMIPGIPPVPKLREEDALSLKEHAKACRDWATLHPEAYHQLVNEARNLYRR